MSAPWLTTYEPPARPPSQQDIERARLTGYRLPDDSDVSLLACQGCGDES